VRRERQMEAFVFIIKECLKVTENGCASDSKRALVKSDESGTGEERELMIKRCWTRELNL
jgi:hypothetical protein